MRYIIAFLILSGCSAEMELAKEDPVLVSGAASIFIMTVVGLAQ